jgi:hypothetical protein
MSHFAGHVNRHLFDVFAGILEAELGRGQIFRNNATESSPPEQSRSDPYLPPN